LAASVVLSQHEAIGGNLDVPPSAGIKNGKLGPIGITDSFFSIAPSGTSD